MAEEATVRARVRRPPGTALVRATGRIAAVVVAYLAGVLILEESPGGAPRLGWPTTAGVLSARLEAVLGAPPAPS